MLTVHHFMCIDQGKKRGAASADGSVEGEHEESDGSEAELVERAQNGVRGGKSSRAKVCI